MNYVKENVGIYIKDTTEKDNGYNVGEIYFEILKGPDAYDNPRFIYGGRFIYAKTTGHIDIEFHTDYSKKALGDNIDGNISKHIIKAVNKGAKN